MFSRSGCSVSRAALALIPLEKLFSGRDAILIYRQSSDSLSPQASADPFDHVHTDPHVVTLLQRRHWKIPPTEWSMALRRVEQGEPLRTIAKDYTVSYEAIRRIIRAARRP